MVRLNLEFATFVIEQIRRIQQMTGAPTMVAVVRRAIEVWHQIQTAIKNGDRIVFRAADGTEREVIIL